MFIYSFALYQQNKKQNKKITALEKMWINTIQTNMNGTSTIDRCF